MGTSQPKIFELSAKVDLTFRNLMGSQPDLMIKDHLYVGHRLESVALAETLVQMIGEDVYVSIRFSPEISKKAEEMPCPYDLLSHQNLNILLVVAEELSHLHCLCEIAKSNQTISKWDLELQSEFDKFRIAAHILETQTGNSHVTSLARLIFDSSYCYSEDSQYEYTGRLAARWWWSHINRYQSKTLMIPEVLRALQEMRHLYGCSKLDYLKQTEARVLKRAG